MEALINALPGSIAQGLIWGILAIGVYITYKVLDYADLTVDGSLATGGAVAVMCKYGSGTGNQYQRPEGTRAGAFQRTGRRFRSAVCTVSGKRRCKYGTWSYCNRSCSSYYRRSNIWKNISQFCASYDSLCGGSHHLLYCNCYCSAARIIHQ